MVHLSLKIGGMSCAHCVQAVRKALQGAPGVEAQRVEVGAAEMDYDPARTDPERIVAAIREAGFEAKS